MDCLLCFEALLIKMGEFGKMKRDVQFSNLPCFGDLVVWFGASSYVEWRMRILAMKLA